MTDYIYDIESYPNIFTLCVHSSVDNEKHLFEISERRNEIVAMRDFMSYLAQNNHRLVGFNNIGYDYPMLHNLLMFPYEASAAFAYEKNLQIFNTPWEDRFRTQVYESEHLVHQVDLYMIHHFDNQARRTGLKIIEYNMRMSSIQELPFTPGTCLTYDQMDKLIEYNHHDVVATGLFYHETKTMIDFRKQLSVTYNTNMTNYNDTKIGKSYFIDKLENSSPGCCYKRVNGRKVKQQTYRDHGVGLRGIIFDYVNFEHIEFQRVLDFLSNTTIHETKNTPELKGLKATIDHFTYHFGAGGVHGSKSKKIVRSTDTHMILDLDVASYYPNLAIKNKLYPEHLGENFCEIYEELYTMRKQHKKGTSENAMLKLALNGSYGESNSEYSPLYDPQFTMSITINGQLLLCMFAEQLHKIPGLQMVQINTDGLSVKVERKYYDHIMSLVKWWEDLTRLELECVEYKAMYIRDVNNYIAEKMNGELKRKGSYCYKLDPGNEMDWHQNLSALVVPMAAEAFLVRGTPIDEFIHNHDDAFDFMLRTKVPGSSRLMLGDKQIQNVSRYFIANNGSQLVKIMPPLAKAPDKERHFKINAGFLVRECNNIQDANPWDVNHDWYINEVRKLVGVLS